MFRRFVSSLLIVGYVASQLAALPHAHAAGTLAEHEQASLPHFHFHSAGHDHPHTGEHHQHHTAHGHPHSPSVSSQPTAERPTLLARTQIGLTDRTHDFDVVYLPVGATLVSHGSDAQIDSIIATWSSSVLPIAVQLAQAGSWSSLAARAFICSDGSGLYLALRNLRI